MATGATEASGAVCVEGEGATTAGQTDQPQLRGRAGAAHARTRMSSGCSAISYSNLPARRSSFDRYATQAKPRRPVRYLLPPAASSAAQPTTLVARKRKRALTSRSVILHSLGVHSE